MKQKGLTLIELMIVIAIIGIVVAVAAPVIFGDSSTRSHSYGINGLAEIRCIEGMKFVVGRSGSVQQMLGPNGGGIPCQ